MVGYMGKIVALAVGAAALTVAVAAWVGGTSPAILLVTLGISALLLWRTLRG